MLAISIKPPHIQRILSGEKTLEVRSWSTKHRGDLLLVCSRQPATPDGGKALAVFDIIDCRSMTPADALAAMTDYEPGQYVWQIDNVRPITPFDVRGKLGLYEVLYHSAREAGDD